MRTGSFAALGVVAQMGVRCEPWEFLARTRQRHPKLHTPAGQWAIPKADWAQHRAQWNTTKTRFSACWCLATQFCERRWNRVTRGVACAVFISHFDHLCHSADFSRHSGHSRHSHSSTRREEANCLSSRLVPSNARDPSALVAPQSGNGGAPRHPIGDPVEKPHPSGQSQLAAAARVGRLRWDEVGELDGLGALGDPLAQRCPTLLFFHFVPPPFASSLLLHPPRPRQTTSNPHPRSSATFASDYTSRPHKTTSSTLPRLCRLFSNTPSTVFDCSTATALVSVPLLLSHNTWV